MSAPQNIATKVAGKPALKAKDFKTKLKPIWCPGCGDFSIIAAITRSFAWQEMNKAETAIVSGIGCSSRIPAYIDTYGFHGVHGRPLAVASGLKAARPDLNVLAAGGDGDGYSIGGNHFIHACRRNMDITYIVMDNEVYGMTKGQSSPTTDASWENKLAPHGTGMRPFNPMAIALASGASFIARGFTGKPAVLSKIITEAIEHKGFSFIEVLSPCVTFRPSQKEWKQQVQEGDFESTANIAEASHRIYTMDPLETGIVFKADLPVWQPEHRKTADIEDFAEEFCV